MNEKERPADQLSAQHQLKLAQVPTKDLVSELQRREGIESTIAEPYQDVEVKASGPAIVLVVMD